MNNHLNHEQLCDLLLANRTGSLTAGSTEIERSREHVRDCHICAAELSMLDHSLLLFRSTANAWASHEWHDHQSLLQSHSLKPAGTGGVMAFFARPVVWASAVATALLAITLPLALHRTDAASVKAPTTITAPVNIHATETSQSDEALLEEIDQTLSAPIPTAMEPLADPTAGRRTQSDTTPRKN